jgi:hypothetical protein
VSGKSRVFLRGLSVKGESLKAKAVPSLVTRILRNSGGFCISPSVTVVEYVFFFYILILKNKHKQCWRPFMKALK